MKTISAPLPVLDANGQPAVLDTPTSSGGLLPGCEATGTTPPTVATVGSLIQKSEKSVGTDAALEAASDMNSAFVTVALSINITSNGIYATSRCSSPARTSASNSSDQVASSSSTVASGPLKLSLGEAGTRSNGGNSLPTSQPPTPQACPGMDTYIMDLQHKLLDLTRSQQQQQHVQQHQTSPDTAQLPSPSSSTKEGTPFPEPTAVVPTAADQVDQAVDNNRQPRKVLPSTIDIHDLETELSKLHSQGGHPSMLKTKDTPPNPSSSGATESTSNPLLQSATASPPELADEVIPATVTVVPSLPIQLPAVPILPAVLPTIAATSIPAAVAAAKEQKSSQTEPQTPAHPRKLSLPPIQSSPGRRISRFSVSLVEEQASSSNGPLAEVAINDPELRDILCRHEQERKALATKHEEELAAYRAKIKSSLPSLPVGPTQSPHQQQMPQQPPPAQPAKQVHPSPQPQLQRQEATEMAARTPSPGARTSPDPSEPMGCCFPIPNNNSSLSGSNSSIGGSGGGGSGGGVGNGNGNGQVTLNSTPSSSPGTPTRQTKTFTDDLLRLVQDLGSKPGTEKSKKAGGEGVEKAPTLNQLRAGATLSANQQQQQQQHHSLTHSAGILKPST